MPKSEQCLTCIHYQFDKTCAAFPKGIPDEVITGEHDHKYAYKGDNGIRWERFPLGNEKKD